jgi:hypothetical protein
MNRFSTSATIAAVFGALVLLSGCAQEIAHSESDKRGWFGEQKHTEDTLYKNPDGTLSHEHSETKVK